MNLIEGAEAVIKTRQAWLSEATKAGEAVKELPEEIKALEADSVEADISGGILNLSFVFYHESTESKAREAMKTLMRAGVVFQTKPTANWQGNKVNYRAERQKIGDIELTAYLSGLPKPPNCLIREVPNTGTHMEIVCAMEEVPA
jgi:hypothetical protein